MHCPSYYNPENPYPTLQQFTQRVAAELEQLQQAETAHAQRLPDYDYRGLWRELDNLWERAYNENARRDAQEQMRLWAIEEELKEARRWRQQGGIEPEFLKVIEVSRYLNVWH
jgi:DNA-binding NtrC family response regulator